MIQDVRRCYNCKLVSLDDLEIQEAYNRLCVDGKLKEEYQTIKKKGLTHALDTPTVFKVEWIKIVLSRIDDGCIWLESGLVKLTKLMIHRVTRYPTTNQSCAIRSYSKEIIEKNTGAIGDKHGMTIDTITNPLVEFVVRVIAHKFYQSNKINSIPCVAVDMSYKMVKRDHTYDLAKPLL